MNSYVKYDDAKVVVFSEKKRGKIRINGGKIRIFTDLWPFFV